VDNVVDRASPIADTYALKTEHLTPSQCDFFRKWEHLIAMEEGDLMRFRKELWTTGASERERLGRCFADMRLDNAYRPQERGNSGGRQERIRQFTYRFVRAAPRREGSLLSGHICVGDAVTVSVEPDLLALSRGFVLELNPHGVVVGVDHKLSVDVVKTRLAGRGGAPGGSVVFRLDKDEMFGGMGRIRENLAQLFYAGGDKKRLELVVDLRKPRFSPCDSVEPSPSLPSTLNENQRLAVSKVLRAEDYALILGMPGTGKTTVVAALIRTLVAMGKTVLLTSYTHSAVDTILAKLSDEPFGILRLGNADKVGHRWWTAARGVDAL
jgi:DNA replication ATP-dependent helicase Dna2